MRYLLFSYFLFVTIYPIAAQNPYFIELNTGKILYGDNEIKNRIFGQTTIIYNSMEYPLNEINCFRNAEGYFMVIDESAISGPQLIKCIEEGKINLYSRTESYYSPTFVHTISTPGGPIMSVSPGYSYSNSIDYFCKEGGYLQKMNCSNLKISLDDNKESQKYLKQYQILNTIRTGSLVVGLGMIVISLTQMDKDHKPSLGLLISGGIIANLSWFIGTSQEKKLREAVRVYNITP